MGLHDKVLVVGSYRSGFCKKMLEVPACPIKSIPDGSKIDTSLDKAEPVRNGGRDSVITYRYGNGAGEGHGAHDLE